ncbi:MAG: thioredoxin [Candidatus Marinimicrobia bacterium]|jgi:thioredoxin 1|nr:thioredoxin [Candidatus Neomarinimicrobiota bacterium]HJM47681.1 thioredoxin [Candidatus Neomarinimicrobiota bacterium]|tara:strand:+ start:6750 stop:7076 length:327 start_codon:yes stop_codon:yes gene_type:complete
MTENVMEFCDNNFELEVLKSDIPVLVDFWAEWCGPCKALAPTVAELADEYKDKVKVGKVNIDSNGNTATNYGVRSIPTLLIFQNGAILNQIVGNVAKESITKILNEVV